MPNLRIATGAHLNADGLHADITYTDAGTEWTDATMTELDAGKRPEWTVNGAARSCTYVGAVVVGSNLLVTVLLASRIHGGDVVSAITGAAGWLSNAGTQETGGATLSGITGGSEEQTGIELRTSLGPRMGRARM